MPPEFSYTKILRLKQGRRGVCTAYRSPPSVQLNSSSVKIEQPAISPVGQALPILSVRLCHCLFEFSYTKIFRYSSRGKRRANRLPSIFFCAIRFSSTKIYITQLSHSSKTLPYPCRLVEQSALSVFRIRKISKIINVQPDHWKS